VSFKPKLSDATLADLRRSGLDKSDALKMGIREMRASDVRKYDRQFDATGYEIPYPGVNGYSRVRFHEPQPDKKGKKRKYTQPAKTGVEVYKPANVNWRAIADDDGTKTVVGITEGEKKAYKACKEGIPCLALGGVDSFKSRRLGIRLLPDLITLAKAIELEIVYDAEYESNANVRLAAHRLAQAMTDAGCSKVRFVDLPKLEKLDDWLVRMAKEELDPAEEYAKLPRRDYSVRDQCDAVRSDLGMPQRKRREKLFAVILDDLKKNWTGHRVTIGEACQLYLFDKAKARLHLLEENAATGEFVARFNELYGINGSEPEWKWLLNELHSHYLREGKESQIHELSAASQNRRKLYIYNGDHEMYRITERKTDKVNNGKDGILFRNPGMASFEPADTANREAMQLLVHTPNFTATARITVKQQRMLFECWLWGLFFPHLLPTRAIMLLYGPKGSFKSSATRRAKQTLFGAKQNVTSLNPEKLSDFVSVLCTDYLATLDNIDGAHDGVENLFAVAATGGLHEERTLFKNLQKSSALLDAFIAATSRDPKPFRRDDVVDRLLLLCVKRSSEFIGEAELLRATEANRSAFWRYALDTLPKLMRRLRLYKKRTSRFRLADFSRFCMAIAPELGYTRKSMKVALRAHENEKASFEVETLSLPQAIRVVLSSQRAMEALSAAEVFGQLKEHVHDFPFKSAKSLGKQLNSKSVLRGLRQEGIAIKVAKDAHTKIKTYTFSLAEGAQ
jgi:hypothetical protein